MKRSDLQELHYILHSNNLSSVLRIGLLSHDRTAKIRHRSIAMDEIQELRTKKVVPRAKPLHSYVNLYFNARNKMMFKCKKTLPQTDFERLCVIRVSVDVLDLPGVVIADQNAAASIVGFYPSPDGLATIDKERVFARYWNHPENPEESIRHGLAMCAEVLVPDTVDPSYILGLYLPTSSAANVESGLMQGIPATVNANLFFM